MASYEEFYLKCPANVVEYEIVEISHPDFTTVRRIVRNKVGGLGLTIEGVYHTWQYYPLQITSKGSRADMDYGLQINLGDLGDIVGAEMDAVAAADGFLIRPKVRYWTFRSDDLSAPLFGPIILEVVDMPITPEGTSFLAQAPSLNNNRTGEIYTVERFPMLDAFL